ncbi:MAG: hypothetical protein RLZZ273_101, partial [Bacteroidota bacterium]
MIEPKNRAVLICILAMALFTSTKAQRSDAAYVGKFKSVMQSLSNYRYGDISVFRLEGNLFNTVRDHLNPPPIDKTGAIERLRSTNSAFLEEIRKAVRKKQDRDAIDALLEEVAEGIEVSDPDVQNAIAYYLDEKAYKSELFTGAYLVTTKYQRGESGDDLLIIGFIKTRTKATGSAASAVSDLKNVIVSDIETGFELKRLPPPATDKSYEDKMYGYLKDQVVQSNVKNVTLEAQGIDDVETRFVRQTFGNTVQISEDDVQQFIKITNGIPVSYYGPNELTISAPDLISYRRYRPDPVGATITVLEMDSTGTEVEVEKEVPTYNSRLAQYGFELRSGLEDLNYPSTWSERLALNAIWSQAKLGIILPTSGLASVASSFGNTRTMTHAGFGVNTSIEVPIKLIAESGV